MPFLKKDPGLATALRMVTKKDVGYSKMIENKEVAFLKSVERTHLPIRDRLP